MKTKYFAVGTILVFALQGCGSQSDIELLKNGIMQFNETLTVGEAFDAWSNCQQSEWQEFSTENGQRVVQFSCVTKDIPILVNRLKSSQEEEYEFLDILSMTSVFQWTINTDNSFQLSYVERIWQWEDGKKLAMQDEPEILLGMVFNNETTFDVSELDDPNTGEDLVSLLTDMLLELYYAAE